MVAGFLEGPAAMRRAERLFQIVQLLRGRRLTTARWLGQRLEVSERTVYRDIHDLILSGVPIEGEAGMGYRLARGFDLPPITFLPDEIEALVVGARLVRAWGGVNLGKAADHALTKIHAVLPAPLKKEIAKSAVYAPDVGSDLPVLERLDVLRGAVNQRRKLRIDYVREDGEGSMRVLRPLGLFFWSPAWTLCAWCELRGDYRNFRIDRMREIAVLEEHFELTEAVSLETYLRSLGPHSARLADERAASLKS